MLDTKYLLDSVKMAGNTCEQVTPELTFMKHTG